MPQADGSRSLSSRLRATARAASHEAKRWSYLDLGGGPEDTVFIAGSGRSGTTWVEEVVNRHHDHRVLFEPFWGRHVRQVRHFSEHQYIRPGNDDPRYVDPVRQILSGRVRNRWIDHQNTVHVAHKRLVKEIRANNWIGWAADQWPQMPVVFVIRHPMAVASSRLAMGWEDGLDWVLDQPEMLDDHFDADTQAYLRSLVTPWERAIARWCVENMVPFRTLGGRGATLIVYEELASRAPQTTARLLAAVGQEPDDALDAALDQPSRLARGPVSGVGSGFADKWVTKVDAARRRTGVCVIDTLGFGSVFDDGPVPNVDAAQQLWERPSGARLGGSDQGH